MKPKSQNQKKKYAQLNERLQEYSDRSELLLDNMNENVAQAISTTDINDGAFHFKEHTELNDTADRVRNAFILGLWALISDGIDKEWTNAQKSIKSLIKNATIVYDEVYDDKYTANTSNAFKKRTAGGLTISQRIWRRYYDYKDFIETSISASIQKGMNANQIKTALTNDLQDVNGLRLRYKDMFRTTPKVKDVKYHITRLVASEINMAYRESEQQGWRQLDFVLGLKINLSGSHKLKDICDDLAGVYPKSFKWYGWHPLDRCYMTPVIMSDTDFWDWNNGGIKRGEVTDVPQNFKQWVDDNVEKINSAKSPYFFISDNWDGRLKDYARYKTDSNYKDVAFDFISGGMKATHGGHINHDAKEYVFFGNMTSTDLEHECQNELVRMGHKVILRNENVYDTKGNRMTQLDMELDGMVMDIRSITTAEYYGGALFSKCSQAYRFNSNPINKVKTDAVCFYFHDPSDFMEWKISNAFGWLFKKLDEKGWEQNIHTLFCVVRGETKMRHYSIKRR